MRDYKVYLPHHRDDQRYKPLVDRVSFVIAVAVFTVMIWFICTALADAVVATAEIEEAQAKSWLAETYQRPLGYRLEYPTADQMERTEAMLRLQPLVREQ
jgi:hypothetical protein